MLEVQHSKGEKAWVSLKNRTHYSLLKSTIRPWELPELAKKNSMSAVGICDENNLFGALEFSNYCISNKIQPIISAEFEFDFFF
jgi:DNA polymerase-3 subunit alpha